MTRDRIAHLLAATLPKALAWSIADTTDECSEAHACRSTSRAIDAHTSLVELQARVVDFVASLGLGTDSAPAQRMMLAGAIIAIIAEQDREMTLAGSGLWSDRG